MLGTAVAVMLSTAVTKAVLGRVPAIRRYQVLYRDLFTKEMAGWPPDLRAGLGAGVLWG